jgi:predicted transcriptional regulator
MQGLTIKEEAHRLIDGLPDEATWDDLMYRIYVRQAIEAGMEDSEQGRTVTVEAVRQEFGLPIAFPVAKR